MQVKPRNSFSAWFGRNSPMIAYYGKRFLVYLFTLWGAMTLSFVAFRSMPGDPMTIVMAQLTRSTGKVIGSPAVAEYYRNLFGLDKPMFVQYLVYLRNIILGPMDLGPSFVAFPKPARELIFSQMPWTLGLMTTSMLLAWLFGTGLGAIAGWLRRSRFSNIVVILSNSIAIIPIYILALGLIFVLGFQLKLLPTNKPYDAHLFPGWNWEFLRSLMLHSILPMLSMILVWGASFTIGMRSLLIGVLGEDYLMYAKAKGLSPMRILRDYAFRNALLPQMAALGIMLGSTINGAFIIEVLFSLPGLGTLFARSMGLRDFNTMQGIVLFSSFTVLTLGLLIDLTLPLLDPRIRRSNA